MGTTENFALPYPGLFDEPNVSLHIQQLAEQADTALQELTDAVEDLGGGEGGGGDAVGGRWYATGAGQVIPATTSGPGTVCKFATAGADPVPVGVTNEDYGGGIGSKFTLGSSGLWYAKASVRVQSSATAGEFSANIRYGPPLPSTSYDTVLDADGGRREGLARTLHPGGIRYLAVGTRLVVHLFNGTGSSRTLEPNSGDWVQIDIWRVG